MSDAVLHFLGIARRGGFLSLGHDAAKESVTGGRAKLCVLSSDASARLEEEFRTLGNGRLPILRLPHTMEDKKHALGFKAGVLTADDEGIAKRIAGLCAIN